MNRALYPGSFDPFTNGHLSVLEKAIDLFDEIVIAVSVNPAKKRRFEEPNAVYSIWKAIENKPYKNKVHIINTDDSIPARIAQTYKCKYIIRGIRNDMDYNYEEGLALYNKEFDNSIETIYFRADNSAISSTMVYSFMKSYVPVEQYLPYDPFLLEICSLSDFRPEKPFSEMMKCLESIAELNYNWSLNIKEEK